MNTDKSLPKPTAKAAKSKEVQEIVIAFPESDREWMSLQQHVIDLTSKPIEDAAWSELGTLRAALTAAEMNAVLSYRRRKRLESSAPFDGIRAARRNPEGWEDWKCDKDYDWMLTFQDWMRALLFTVDEHSEDGNYQRVLHKIKRELSSVLKPYPDRARELKDGCSVRSWLLYNVPMVFPNDEGEELLKKWWNQLRRRKEQLKRFKPESPKDSWFEALNRRSKDFQKVCEKAMEAGLLSMRGSHLYFDGHCLGNGMHGSAWRTVQENYELEAEIRIAVKKATHREAKL